MPLQTMAWSMVLDHDTKAGQHLDDGRDELQQEAGHAQQGGVEVVQEVHDQALDVAAVVVLVRHDHEVPVAQLLRAVVALRDEGHQHNNRHDSVSVLACAVPAGG